MPLLVNLNKLMKLTKFTATALQRNSWKKLQILTDDCPSYQRAFMMILIKKFLSRIPMTVLVATATCSTYEHLNLENLPILIVSLCQ